MSDKRRSPGVPHDRGRSPLPAGPAAARPPSLGVPERCPRCKRPSSVGTGWMFMGNDTIGMPMYAGGDRAGGGRYCGESGAASP